VYRVNISTVQWFSMFNIGLVTMTDEWIVTDLKLKWVCTVENLFNLGTL